MWSNGPLIWARADDNDHKVNCKLNCNSAQYRESLQHSHNRSNLARAAEFISHTFHTKRSLLRGKYAFDLAHAASP